MYAMIITNTGGPDVLHYGELPTPVPQASPDEHVVVDDGKQTIVMDAVDPALLEQLAAGTSGELPVVVDDGKKTIVMESVDVSALGLEPLGDDDSGAIDPDANGSPDKKKRKKRR